jgi:putative ABC transport system permease protein
MNRQLLTSYIRVSLEDLKRNRVRTALTSLGILIGVFSVVLLTAFGFGLKNFINQQFESLGTNLILVVPGKVITSGGFRSGPGSFTSNRFDDTDLFRLRRLNWADAVVPAFTKTVTVEAATKSQLSDLVATTSEFFPVRNFEIDQGRLFTESDNSKRSKVAVIGPKIATEIYGSKTNAIGKTLRIENQGFTVIGVLLAKGGGGIGGTDIDTFTFIPTKSALRFNPSKSYMMLNIQARTDAYVEPLKREITNTLLRRYNADDFSVVELTEIQNVVSSILTVLNTVLFAIGSISLIVGGIGIMNIMYAAVTERTKEIGIRRAIGATERDILSQFLSQAIILCVIGGTLGLLLAWVIVLFVQRVFPATVNVFSVAIALIISTLIGITFGVLPALRAAKLTPIEAIRYE